VVEDEAELEHAEEEEEKERDDGGELDEALPSLASAPVGRACLRDRPLGGAALEGVSSGVERPPRPGHHRAAHRIGSMTMTFDRSNV
jgi:hypothetical protein